MFVRSGIVVVAETCTHEAVSVAVHHHCACISNLSFVFLSQIINSANWAYSSRGWESVFLPLSESCTSVGDDHVTEWKPGMDLTDDHFKVVHLPHLSTLIKDKNFTRFSIPADILNQLAPLHGDPRMWWVGHVMSYVSRLNPVMEKFVQERVDLLGFRHPVVGIQVRRGDKVIHEGKFHSLDKYMDHVKDFYNREFPVAKYKHVTRRVFMATDEESLHSEARKEYPDFEFIGDPEISKSAGNLTTRYSETALRDVISDLYLLSRSDFLVCTFNSNVGRAAFELMQTASRDNSKQVRSLHNHSFLKDKLFTKKTK